MLKTRGKHGDASRSDQKYCGGDGMVDRVCGRCRTVGICRFVDLVIQRTVFEKSSARCSQASAARVLARARYATLALRVRKAGSPRSTARQWQRMAARWRFSDCHITVHGRRSSSLLGASHTFLLRAAWRWGPRLHIHAQPRALPLGSFNRSAFPQQRVGLRQA